ncbi:hypothetical protein SODG_001237 [Sodalis praecaptivus]
MYKNILVPVDIFCRVWRIKPSAMLNFWQKVRLDRSI